MKDLLIAFLITLLTILLQLFLLVLGIPPIVSVLIAVGFFTIVCMKSLD